MATEELSHGMVMISMMDSSKMGNFMDMSDLLIIEVLSILNNQYIKMGNLLNISEITNLSSKFKIFNLLVNKDKYFTFICLIVLYYITYIGFVKKVT